MYTKFDWEWKVGIKEKTIEKENTIKKRKTYHQTGFVNII